VELLHLTRRHAQASCGAAVPHQMARAGEQWSCYATPGGMHRWAVRRAGMVSSKWYALSSDAILQPYCSAAMTVG